MALPAGITTCVVTAGAPLDFAGQGGTITLTVTPVLGGNATNIVWQATGQPLVNFPMTATADATEQAQVVIPHSNQTGFVDGSGNTFTGWSYKAQIVFKGANRQQVAWTKVFQIPSGQAQIDLDLVPDGSITSPTTAPTEPVTSVNGQTGAVTVQGATDAAVAATITQPLTSAAVMGEVATSDNGRDALRARFARTNPPRWSQVDDGLAALTSAGLTTSGAKISATTGGTNGDAILPIWGDRIDMRASFKVTATKSTVGSRSTIGFTVSDRGILPSGTGATTAGVYAVGYMQGSGIALLRDNINATPQVIVADTSLTDGTDYLVTAQVEGTVSQASGAANGTFSWRVFSADGKTSLAQGNTTYVHQYYVPRNALIRTNVAAGAISEARISIHPAGAVDAPTAYQASTVTSPVADSAFFRVPANPNGKTVIALHGHGGNDYETGWQSTLYAPTWQALEKAGYLVVVPRLNGDKWGNQQVMDILAGTWALVLDAFEVERDGVYLWGNSMGGAATCTVIAKDILPVKAAYVAQPAADYDALETLFPELAPGAGVYATTAERDSYNPLKQPAGAYDVPMMIVASPSDTTAVKANNADVIASLATSNGTLVRQITASGNHNDPSMFRADDTLRWFRSFG